MSVSDTTPAAASHVPRIEVTAKITRYEFRNVKDLVQCLNDGTFKFVFEVNDSHWATQERLTVVMNGKFADRAAGPVHIGLMRKGIDILSEDGKEKLVYNFLQEKDEDYYSKMDTEDTQDDWDAVRLAYAKPLTVLLQKYYSSDTVLSIFKPQRLKMDFPSTNSVVRMNDEGVREVVEPSFHLASHVKATGCLKVRFGAMWVVHTKRLDQNLVGFKVSLDKTKFLTDEQRLAAKAEKEADKKAQEAGLKRSAPAAAPAAKKARIPED